MAFKFRIEKLIFKDQDPLELPEGAVVVLVGPNNSGKTTVLRNIAYNYDKELQGFEILKDIEFNELPPAADFEKWVREKLHIDRRTRGALVHANHLQRPLSITLSLLHNPGSYQTILFTQGYPALVKLLRVEDRIKASSQTGSFDVQKDPPRHPLHYISIDKQLMELVNSTFKLAFDRELYINRQAGPHVRLHVGEKPKSWDVDELVIEKLNRDPELDTQGDGVRSFAGCLLELVTGPQFVVLIDEPEMLLHPPQARLLGKYIMQHKPAERQIFVATHSVDVLRGILDAGSEEVIVARIYRKGDGNPISVLKSDKIKELWSDSLLRTSNIFDGLFHELVIVCEGDPDCRFYGAIFEALRDASGESGFPDAIFVHGGGKGKIPKIVEALRAVDVPVCVIADFDVLQQRDNFGKICETLEIKWNDVEAHWRAITSCINGKSPDLNMNQFKQEVSRFLSENEGDYVQERTRANITKALKKISPWARIKESGKSALPRGEITTQYNELNSTLRNAGLFVVECGELEGFCQSIGGKGPKWVSQVLEKNLLEDLELEPAQQFVRSVADWYQRRFTT